MNSHLKIELERLTRNAGRKREHLLLSGLRKSQVRKALNITAGVLALISAGAITTVLADLFGEKGIQFLAAIVAGISGIISLVISAYFNDDEIFNKLSGASKYLSLRESVYRMAINPNISDQECFDTLVELQEEYSELDEKYSRYFPLIQHRIRSGLGFEMTGVGRIDNPTNAAIDKDVHDLYSKIEKRKL